MTKRPRFLTGAALPRGRVRLGIVALVMLLVAGCGGDRRDGGGSGVERRPAATRPAGGVMDPAGMAEEDALRLQPVSPERPPRRPEPVQRPARSPVDQPRIR